MEAAELQPGASPPLISGRIAETTNDSTNNDQDIDSGSDSDMSTGTVVGRDIHAAGKGGTIVNDDDDSNHVSPDLNSDEDPQDTLERERIPFIQQTHQLPSFQSAFPHSLFLKDNRQENEHLQDVQPQHPRTPTSSSSNIAENRGEGNLPAYSTNFRNDNNIRRNFSKENIVNAGRISKNESECAASDIYACYRTCIQALNKTFTSGPSSHIFSSLLPHLEGMNIVVKEGEDDFNNDLLLNDHSNHHDKFCSFPGKNENNQSNGTYVFTVQSRTTDQKTRIETVVIPEGASADLHENEDCDSA